MELRHLQDVGPWDWPEGTADEIQKTLKNRKAPTADRLIAAEMAGDLPDKTEELSEILLSLVSDGSEPAELRSQAAIALGPILEEAEMEGFEDDGISEPPVSEELFLEIQKTFRQVHANEAEPLDVRRRALEASVRAQDDWHADALRTAYGRADRLWKLTAVFSMQYVRGFEKEILESLDNPDPDIHYEAVRAAGKQQVEAAWPHVEALMTAQETDKPLRIVAIEAAAGVNPKEALEMLYRFTQSEDEDIADAAEEAMTDAEINMGADEFGEELEDEEEEDEG